MNHVTRNNIRRANKPNDNWDQDDDFLEKDRALPLMLDEYQIGLLVPRVQSGFQQIVLGRGVVLDRESTAYRFHPGDGVTGGLWFELPGDASPQGKAKGDTRRSNKPNDNWDQDDDFLEKDRALPLMLDEYQIGLLVPRVQSGFQQIVLGRGVVLDRESTAYRFHPGDGVTGGLWFELPGDASPQGKAKGDRGRRKT